MTMCNQLFAVCTFVTLRATVIVRRKRCERPWGYFCTTNR
jgi:hypothetical protein